MFEREKWTMFLDDNKLKLSAGAAELLKSRYLLKDDNSNIIETPGELFLRCASEIAKAQNLFNSHYTEEFAGEKFYNMMVNLDFLPNSPTLMNAGTEKGQLSACFVLPVGDSIEEIFDALKYMAMIHQSGGGTGFDFSRIRPAGDPVSSTKGRASGPLSFMSVFNRTTDVIMQGGKRRGANMGILRCDHPDIIEFIKSKEDLNNFVNFNLSVGITDEFMSAYFNNEDFNLINPRTNKITGSVNAGELFSLIVQAAWKSGDPGLIFLDEINRKNPVPGAGVIAATNPCGELPLLPYESCNLGSINLSNMVEKNDINWDKLADTVVWAVRFLDNVIEVNKYPLEMIKQVTMENRKIGLGVMGFADMLLKCGIPYNSKKAYEFAGSIMSFIKKHSIRASVDLAYERGVFPNYNKSIYYSKGVKMRNAALNTIAPTGSTSMIAGCSSGIEPLFGILIKRNVLSGKHFYEMNPVFKDRVYDTGIISEEMLSKIASSGSLQHIKEVPVDLRKIFVTAFDINPVDHLLIQAAFQENVDNSVSKTINLPGSAGESDVRDIFLKAYEYRCKGITIYRDGSKHEQVLSLYNSSDECNSSNCFL